LSEVTRILGRVEQGDRLAANELLPLVYDELRRLAAQRLAHEKPGQTLNATSLVHEAYLRLVDGEQSRDWNSRGHFFGAAAEAMRRILIEAARRRQALRHGGGHERAALPEDLAAITCTGIEEDELLALDEALQKLAAEDKPKAELVKLRYFAGLSLEEAGDALGISRATANRHWTYALAWLGDAMRAKKISQ